ncbi:MAG: 1-acyl-sn-glycerol-3-phosphate acyltransferase [Acidobacteriota bacterium]|nr:1-acyl-sn-glycerol-3-phosphate acyltransferase [Acidobacteriota bacterium]
MSEHLTQTFSEKLAKNQKIVFSEQKFITKRNFTGRLWYFWSLTVVAFMVFVIAPPILLVLGLIRRREWFYPFARWGARWWLRLCGARVVTKGLENLEPDKAYVFASNHRSYLDTAAMFAHTGKKMGLVAKKELLKVPVFGYGMQWVNILPIDRSNAERAYQTLEAVRKKIAEGVSFAIFAEGTRALPAELMPFKRGAFSVALETQTPIVPVAIKNSDYLMGKKTGVAYPGTIELVFLPPIETAGLMVENGMETLRDKTRALIASELAR